MFLELVCDCFGCCKQLRSFQTKPGRRKKNISVRAFVYNMALLLLFNNLMMYCMFSCMFCNIGSRFQCLHFCLSFYSMWDSFQKMWHAAFLYLRKKSKLLSKHSVADGVKCGDFCLKTRSSSEVVQKNKKLDKNTQCVSEIMYTCI